MKIIIQGEAGEGKTAIAYLLFSELHKRGIESTRLNREPDKTKYDFMAPEVFDKLLKEFLDHGGKILIEEQNTAVRVPGTTFYFEKNAEGENQLVCGACKKVLGVGDKFALSSMCLPEYHLTECKGKPDGKEVL